jgi:hypothetical protein
VTRGYGACRWLQHGNGGAGQECSQTTTCLQLHGAIVTCASVLAASSPQDRRRARDETLYPATAPPCPQPASSQRAHCCCTYSPSQPTGDSQQSLSFADREWSAAGFQNPPIHTVAAVGVWSPSGPVCNGRPPPIDQPKSCHRHALILPRPRPRPLLLPLHPTCACPPPHNHRTAPYTRSHVATSLLPADPRARLLCPVAQLPAPRRELPGPRGHSWYVCDAQNAVANTPHPY